MIISYCVQQLQLRAGTMTLYQIVSFKRVQINSVY